ncbi:xylosidase arabinosidase [Lentinula edodes]|uniref:Xylosidase arabinosidase n=1 Tax=Lentinula edodes TaxID=5353 RepID=A0A1Q3ECN3_LENED|nr:xylosidase arabinosidase [Lentinula edodes]
MDGQDGGRVLKRADPSTIQDKFLVGYQGWFTCAGDGEPIDPGHHGWLHWMNYPIPNGGRPTIDPWPDVSEYSPSELYPVPGVKSPSGEPATLFSSRHPKTVQRHFHWMARHGIDGVFLQRFLGQCDTERGSKGIPRLRDEINDRVQEAAEKEGRVFAVMYDVTGVEPDDVMRIFTKDWIHLVREKRILESPNYLRERGMPVIGLWGFGFDKRKDTPELVREVTRFVRDVTPGGAYIMAGTATHWRRSTEDADRNPAFLDVWLKEFDAISPWMVGRLTDEEHVDMYAEHYMKADIELLRKSHEEGGRKIDYIPVIYPGFSGLNLSEGKWKFNQIKRNGGKFLWQQIFNAKRLGLRVMYGAMWDEYDEGTALMPVVEKSRLLPRSDKYSFMALDADGYDLPADWYMRICGFAAEGLRSERMIHETFPSKELQDYWSTRPRFEEINIKSGDFVSGSAGELDGGQSYQSWLAAQKDSKDEVPPPPYSLEAEHSTTTSSQAQASSQSQPADASASSSHHAQNESIVASGLSQPSLANDTTASQFQLLDLKLSHSPSRNPYPRLRIRIRQRIPLPHLTGLLQNGMQIPIDLLLRCPISRIDQIEPRHKLRLLYRRRLRGQLVLMILRVGSYTHPDQHCLFLKLMFLDQQVLVIIELVAQLRIHLQEAHRFLLDPTVRLRFKKALRTLRIPRIRAVLPFVLNFMSTFGSSYPGMSPPHSPSVGGFPDPYYNGHAPPPSQQYQMPGYPPSQNTFPQSSYNSPGQWSTPPSIPPRPANLTSPTSPPNQYQPYPGSYSSYPQHMPSAPSSSSFSSYARNAVDKVAGQDTRQQLENKLGSLAQSGSKLFGKFSR